MMKPAYKAIGESKRNKMRTTTKRQAAARRAKTDRARKSLRKKTWGF